MSAAENAGGCPDADKPGMPLNPERSSWWWVNGSVKFWNSDRQQWKHDDGVEVFYTDPKDAARWNWNVVGPCLTPSEIAAREAAAAMAMRNACVAEYEENRHNHWDVFGTAIVAIRALPLPAAAQAALDAVVRAAVEKEREACAAIAEDKALPAPWTPQHDAAKQFGLTIAAAIRARGEDTRDE